MSPRQSSWVDERTTHIYLVQICTGQVVNDEGTIAHWSVSRLLDMQIHVVFVIPRKYSCLD